MCLRDVRMNTNSKIKYKLKFQKKKKNLYIDFYIARRQFDVAIAGHRKLGTTAQ